MRKLVLFALGVALSASAAPASAAIPGRDADPVVLTGADLPTITGALPTDVVGFRWAGSAWDQVPVQVDERAEVPYNQIYNNASCSFACTYAGLADVYTDPDTWTGADADGTFDAGDEVAFMAKDSGPAAPGGQADPASVVAGTRATVELTDPISGTSGHTVYLFESRTLDPAAGDSYVDYDFNLTAGPYKADYLIPNGPNPETSAVATDYYRHEELKDRWFDENLEILAGSSTEVDVLDGDKAQFAPTTCGRSESTFADAEGAFIVNRSGPVRAIRSYLGANSGPLTQKTHIYYEQREDLRIDLRVHPIPSVMSFLDYSPAAIGMTYRNPANTGGVTIDGVPDPVAESPGGPAWEQVTGDQGTLDIVNRFETDISPTTVSGYYYDEDMPDSGHLQCSGDSAAYGSSGRWVTSAIPNTDPGRPEPAASLAAIRHVFYEPPNQPASQAALRDQQITESLGMSVDGVPVVPDDPPPGEEDSAATISQTILQNPPPPGATPPTQTTKKCPKGKKPKKGKCVKKKKKKKAKQ